MLGEKKNCPVCNSETNFYPNYDKDTVFYTCPVCGRFELSPFDKIDYNHLSAYLVHNCFRHGAFDYRYHTTLDKEKCDEYKDAFEKGDRTHGRPVHMDNEIIENWYPKTFSERVDYILLYFNGKIKHVGQQLAFSLSELLSVMFIDRKEYNKSGFDDSNKLRDIDECEQELQYMLDYLQSTSLVKYNHGPSEEEWLELSLTPKGYARIDELQKNTSYGRKVLVAMKFGDETTNLREAIRAGIKDAKYDPEFIDEVQHNDFITPELLKHIRDSKFVVVDLTHQNNGAYFEEGYAMGLGKPVIQLCKKGVDLHFDIAQKNTIMWESEDDIPKKLTNRIKATID